MRRRWSSKRGSLLWPSHLCDDERGKMSYEKEIEALESEWAPGDGFYTVCGCWLVSGL
jgi:hypothetical protein